MIHYHGGPITPIDAARTVWTGRHAMISHAHPEQVALAAEVCQSFALDNGAFSEWRSTGKPIDIPAYEEWVHEWCRHPGFDWCVIPDVIDGDEATNREMVVDWVLRREADRMPLSLSVPVWHLHESMSYLKWLVHHFPRVCFGSSGEWSQPGNDAWWERMGEAMKVACDSEGRPLCKLHGLRMLNPTIFSHLPLSSADSCGVARNIGIDRKWNHGYLRTLSKATRASILAERYEQHAASAVWEARSEQMSFALLG